MTTDARRGRRYLRLLTDPDRDLLDSAARRAGVPGPRQPGGDAHVEDLLADPDLFDAVVGTTGDDAHESRFDVAVASPFLVFATALHRARAELDPSSVVVEWTGPRERVPVFSGAQLRAFLDDGDHRLFLAELLASYVHLSGAAVTWQQGSAIHHRRVGELDLAGMADLLGMVDERAQAGLYRRLGDASLFLTGVFPDHTSRTRFAPIQVDRLARSLQSSSPAATAELVDALAVHGAVGLVEHLGQQWYRLAVQADGGASPTSGLASISDHFPDARRALNHLADRWLFPFRSSWLATPG